MGRMVLVREVTADDWALMREVRLAALAEAPYAFGSTYAREAGFTEEQWRGRISERSVSFFASAEAAAEPEAVADHGAGAAEVAGAVAGLAGAVAGVAGAVAGLAGVFVEDRQADLVSMWVRPAARGGGVGEALVEAAAAWAKVHEHRDLLLWVTEGNAAARRLYERCGFTATGEAQPLPSDTALTEIRMRRAL